MINDTAAGRWFRRVMWVGIACNLSLALPGLAAPAALTTMFGLPTATPDVWPRLAALLLLLLSVFYTFAAIDLDRYRGLAWASVISRLAGAVFFFLEPAAYHVLAYFDLAFCLALGALLVIALRQARPDAMPGVSAV